jgi:heptosyltransferase-2
VAGAAIPLAATWVRFPRFVGDAAMQLPVLRLLRVMGIGPIVVHGPEATVCLVRDHELADHVVAETGKPGIFELSAIFRRHAPARSIHFPKSLRTPVAACLAGVAERIGVGDGGARFFNTHHAPFWGASGHFVERYRAALEKRWPGLPPMPFAGYAPAVEVDRPNNAYLCLMPGSVWPSKAWPADHFRELAREALNSGLDVVVLGAMSERGLGDSILDGGVRGINLCGSTDLRQAAAWLCGARAAIGNDSGLSHLAAACGVKTVAIFGPTDPAASAPWGPDVTVLRPQGLPCPPCFKRECPLPARECMECVTPGMVLEAIGATRSGASKSTSH